MMRICLHIIFRVPSSGKQPAGRSHVYGRDISADRRRRHRGGPPAEKGVVIVSRTSTGGVAALANRVTHPLGPNASGFFIYTNN